MMNEPDASSSPLPLWERSDRIEDAIRVRGYALSIERNPSPHRTPVLLLRNDLVARSHHDRDVLHAGHLELADLRHRPDGAGAARPRRLHVLAGSRSAAGRLAVVFDQSVLAIADPDVRGFRRRRSAVVAARRAQQ